MPMTLAEEVEYLRGRVKDLERELNTRDGFDMPPRELPNGMQLSETEAQIVALLRNRAFVSNDALWTRLYGTRIDPPDTNTQNVFLSKTRKKLRAHGVEISRLWGRGHYLTPENKAKLAALFGETELQQINETPAAP